MLNIFQQGGPVMWIFLAGSMIAAYIYVSRLFHLHRAQITTQDFLDGIYNVLRRGNVVEAITLCEDTPGPVANIVRAAILKADDDVEDIIRSVQTTGLIEIPRLEKNMVLLATIAKLSPMVGLLGTILGMMHALIQLHAHAPLAHAGDLSIGLWQALISTATGLTIAIPCYAGYNFLVSRVGNIVVEMEKASTEIITFLVRQKRIKSSEV